MKHRIHRVLKTDPVKANHLAKPYLISPGNFTCILLITCISFFQSGLIAQCDTKVSGVFTYCNSFDNGNPVDGYFVGFRVADHTGDTLNVVDINGGAITNKGKRVDGIGDLEPDNISIAPLRISGVGADSTEYWYFGPYANGASFNIALIDPNNTCDTVFVGSGTYNCADNTGISDPSACAPNSTNNPPVPLYYLDFSNEAFDLGDEGNGNFTANKFYIMNRTREQTCCDVGGNSVRCMEMIITLGEDDIGLAIDDIGSGNTAGKLYADSLNGFVCTGNTNLTYPFQQGGGQSNDAPLCFGDVSARDFIVLSCKAGGNPTFLTIAALPTFTAPNLVVQGNCEIQINTYNGINVFWSSPDDPGLNNLHSCHQDSLYCFFNYNQGVFGNITECADTFTYIVGANPTAIGCLPFDTIIYDTIQVIVYPEYSVQISQECAEDGFVTLHASVSTTAPQCSYTLQWSNGATTPTITVPISNTEYYVTVTQSNIPPGIQVCPTVDSIIASGVADINCTSFTNPIFDCISQLPPVNLNLIQATGCNTTFRKLAHTVNSGGSGCVGDTLVFTRYYMIDFDSDTITTLDDRDTCIQRFRFVDKTPPVITCPPDVTIQCNANTSPAATGSATATDNCDNTPTITFSNTTIAGACPQSYIIQRRWIAQDNCPNRDTCFQLITVQDMANPVITCPPDITIAHAESSAPSHTGTATATDCDLTPTITYIDSIFNSECSLYHYIKRNWKATDDCGNQSKCTQWIAVNDAGSICGGVHDDAGQAISGVQLQLFLDVNNNQQADGGDVLTATVTSATNGSYCFTNIKPCNYVVVEIQPANYGEVSDTDSTPDPDGDDSADGPDNQIPVILTQAENDLDNNFIDFICPTQLPSFPFDTICSGQNVVFQVTNPNLALNYSWTFGSGSTPPTGSGPGPLSINYVATTQNQTGGASVMLTISKIGCQSIMGEVTKVFVNTPPDASINADLSNACYYTNKVFQPQAASIPGATYLWTFGADAVPPSAVGYGPHTVYYTGTGTKTAKLVVYPNEAGAQCPDSSTVSFDIVLCPGQIAGYILTTTNEPVTNVTIKLFADNDNDGAADNNTAIRTVTSNFTGLFIMASLTPGNYVLIETQPAGWTNFDDYDASDDDDLVSNTSGMDNLLPVTVLASEVDTMNNFIESAQPGSITGCVFYDLDNDATPDIGEGLDTVTLSLYSDEDMDGHADNGNPVAVVQTNPNGNFSFDSIGVGNYVLVETTPTDYFSYEDIDPSNDNDVVPNTNQNNDTIPVTLMNNETDANNYFLDLKTCPLMVTNTEDEGYGSLRYNLECAGVGDIIHFSLELTGMTIFIMSPIIISNNVVLNSTLVPPLTIASTIPGLLTITPTGNAEFSGFTIIGGLSLNGQGTAIENQGILKLNSVTILRNPLTGPADFLIHNVPGSSLFLSGYCMFGN